MSVKIHQQQKADLGDKIHYEQYQELYDYGALKPSAHRRLVENIQEVAATARIPQKYILRPATEFCTQEEIDWALGIRSYEVEGIAGLIYTGKTSHVVSRMMGLCGLFLRNFYDARMFTSQDLIKSAKKDSSENSTVAFVPNFHQIDINGGDIAKWNIPELLNWVYTRNSLGLQTVLYVQDFNALGNDYGVSFKEFVEDN
ncbi:MAG: hypothetical protein OEX12_12710, partial [Gammaproteobacteria bacterium]|nr:hypothetical protein [Gammaproteobacteria bacterium]